MNTESIVEKLLKAKDAYYDGHPIMTDEAFDTLEEELRELDSENEYFSVVGSEASGEKIRHSVPMLSCAKVKTAQEAIDWALNPSSVLVPFGFIFEPKIDGLSASIKYSNGKLVYVATRGNGKMGQDVTHIKDFVKGIPSNIFAMEDIEVRGELYIPKSTYPNSHELNLRNMAAGFVNRKDSGLEDLRKVEFIAYQMISEYDFKFESEKLSWLRNNRFNVPDSVYIETPNEIEEYYNKYLAVLRDKWEFQTDGLVLIVDNIKDQVKINSLRKIEHHHYHNMAVKPPSVAQNTKLRSIEWNVSRHGKLIPVAVFDSVMFGGAKVSRCTLNNYENVMKLKLHPGDTIRVQRANDVIPWFEANLSKNDATDKNLIPKFCPSCGTKLIVDGINLCCENPKCPEVSYLRIVHWVACCKMEYFSGGSVRKLFGDGVVQSIPDLYRLNEDNLYGIPGFGESSIKNAIEQIEKTKTMTIPEFVDRLGIDLVGIKACKKLGIETVDDLFNFKDTRYAIGCNLIEYVSANKSFIKELLSVIKIKNVEKKNVSAVTLNVCMTGTGPRGRKELIKEIEAKGHSFVDSVGKETNILVCEDENGSSSKLQKARKIGVKLISYEEYFGD